MPCLDCSPKGRTNCIEPSVLLVCLSLPLWPFRAAEPPDSEKARVRRSLHAKPTEGSMRVLAVNGNE